MPNMPLLPEASALSNNCQSQGTNAHSTTNTTTASTSAATTTATSVPPTLLALPSPSAGSSSMSLSPASSVSSSPAASPAYHGQIGSDHGGSTGSNAYTGSSTASSFTTATPLQTQAQAPVDLDNTTLGPRGILKKRQRFTSSLSAPLQSLQQHQQQAASSQSLSAAGASMHSQLPRTRSSQSKIPISKVGRSRDFHCAICRDIMKEAFITRCGHSYCYVCISQHLQTKADCPICGGHLIRDQIFPNFLLNEIIQRSDFGDKENQQPRLRPEQISEAEYTREEIDDMMLTLKAKRRKLDATDQQVELEVLLDFFEKTKREKEEHLARLNGEIQCLDQDMKKAQEQLVALRQLSFDDYLEVKCKDEEHVESLGHLTPSQVPNEVSEEEDEAVPLQAGSKRRHSQIDHGSNSSTEDLDRPPQTNRDVANNPQALKITKLVAANKKRVADHFEDLQRCYFDFTTSSASSKKESALSSLCSTISNFTKYSHFEHVNTLRYGDIYNSSSIVSSIEFDKDDEFFATAGVAKKIKIFEFGCIEKSGFAGTSPRDDDPSELLELEEQASSAGSGLTSLAGRYAMNKKPIKSVLHYPIREMVCRSKISCLSWNPYIKSQIASSDYEGIVSLWDSQTGMCTMSYDEHEKRAWSVDFSRTDPSRLASGSDDTKVKIWSTTQKPSVCTIESKANICCVKFNPESSHHIAFGSADHHIHYYDLRKPNEPLLIFKGHRKAVSYVKFLGRDELVSASTDSTLKLWSPSKMSCTRTFTGHTNEKNFVGLSASGDWISCGSENNAVYTYYKELRDPVVTVKFGNTNPVTGEDVPEEDASQFVSSVCWKKSSSNNILLAANSSGVIKVLEMV